MFFSFVFGLKGVKLKPFLPSLLLLNFDILLFGPSKRVVDPTRLNCCFMFSSFVDDSLLFFEVQHL